MNKKGYDIVEWSFPFMCIVVTIGVMIWIGIMVSDKIYDDMVKECDIEYGEGNWYWNETLKETSCPPQCFNKECIEKNGDT